MTDMPQTDFSTLADDLLRMEEVEADLFRTEWHFGNSLGSVFGGQVFGQALAAAVRTCPDWPAHYMSGGFIRAGKTGHPIDYRVTRLRDGRSFSTRRVSAFQFGKQIFEALVSFHAPEQGPEHQSEIPEGTPSPDDLPDLPILLRQKVDRLPNPKVVDFLSIWPFDLKLVDPEGFLGAHKGADANYDYWVRVRPDAMAKAREGDHQSLFAFISDFWFAGTGLRRHGPPFSGGFQNSTLNHSIWFHAPFSMDDWLLFRVESPVASDVRAQTRGLIHDSSGRLVATAVQELMIRPV